ncbi:CPBP family intramembrane metalloprotease [Micromonospora sp. WMMA1998]|uniref:CPBP family intramembrane glutamic endopeptidase n=1 Tax=Micromonospora sp. WMMA1998 TaxID=3015167 RepID=UPI00248D11A5|nr:CPBP family intramembrane glutamic endopeptidase [Micromonospora sp. WMMA1998]WBC13007.1 CPBP family intramembrane metalloprotease [Micromonospora sp. WMMA1998]
MTTIKNPSWLPPTSDEPRDGPSVPATVEYHRVLAGDKRRIGRGIFAIFLLAVGLVIFPTAIGRAAALIDVQMGKTPPILGGTDYTPLSHASSMIALGLLIPWSMVIQRWLYGVPGASLHSVTSRFRFDLLGRSLLFLGPAWLVANAVPALTPGDEFPWSHFDLIALFVATVLFTPLQSAGEEYGVRGLIFRVVGSWTRNRRAGLVAGVLVSSLLFTAVHGATDPYIIVWYFTLATGLAVITWRTGGLEIAVMLHAALNTFTFLLALVLHVDLGTATQDRSAGTGTPYLLVPTLTVVVITAVVWWRTRRSGPVRTAGPDQPSPLSNFPISAPGPDAVSR